MQVVVRENNVEQALRALKKKMQREGIFREMKARRSYEKPSEKRARQKAEAVRRSRKLARKQAQRELERAAAGGIRLDLDESGCSGYMYELEFVDQPVAGDKHFDVEGVPLYVPEKWLAMLNGLEIDYVKEGVNSLFKLRNPNATGECGCGESFTVEDMDEV